MALYRSLMFVPGNQPRRIEKIPDIPADAFILDLEDSVPFAEKESALQLVCETLRRYPQKRKMVRVNNIYSSFFVREIEKIVCESVSLEGIVLPKTERRDDLLIADYLLTHWERKKGLAAGSIEMMPLIESAAGVQHAYEIASAVPRVKRLAFGTVDFILDIQAEATEAAAETFMARSQLVIASRAAGIEPPIDTVYIRIKDGEGLRRSAQAAKQLGFQGKLLLHPDQVPVVHGVFAISAKEAKEARRIVEAFREAERAGLAAVQLDGNMIDTPVVERAKRILERAGEGDA